MSPTAAPYWLDKPTNLVLAPEENGRLVCRANGNPKPNIQWMVNGQQVESTDGAPPSSSADPDILQRCCSSRSAFSNVPFAPAGAIASKSRQVLGDTIIFRSVQIGSSAVYQCNASNQHGYLLANAFVSVLGETGREAALLRWERAGAASV